MRMIFHHPLPVQADAQAASGIRPFRMIEAFRAIGYEVEAVCGYSDERARAIAEVGARLRRGERYDFVYCESSTEPTLLTDRHHLPLRPWLDFGFLARLKSLGLPIGLFYRDIYWRFPGYGASLPAWKRAGALFCYRYDLYQYRRLIDRLYLPSLQMAQHVPGIDAARVAALPPGCIERPAARSPSDRLRLIYVGGLGEHYRMHELFRALNGLANVELTVCTREAEWRAVQSQYLMPPDGNVRVVHRSGEDVRRLMEDADLGVICVDPHRYWTFAAPLKLYEYVGAKRPVLASSGTLAAEFVASQGIGWVVPYAAPQIAALLRKLAADKSLVDAKMEAVRRILPQHTWEARARQVAAELTRL